MVLITSIIPSGFLEKGNKMLNITMLKISTAELLSCPHSSSAYSKLSLP